MYDGNFIFNHFKKFAAFCLIQKFDEVCSEYENKLNGVNKNSFNVISQLYGDQLCSYFRDRFEHFLKSAMENTPFSEVDLIIKNWKSIQFSNGINRYQIKPNDILLTFLIRNKVLINYLPAFTSNHQELISITEEMILYNHFIETKIVEAYTEIQDDFIRSQQNELNLLKKELLLSSEKSADTTEKFRAEKDFVNAVINNSVDGIFSFDTNLKITAWNNTLERLNGIKEAEAIGKKIFDLFPDYKRGAKEEDFLKVLKGEKVVLGDKSYDSIHRKGFYEAQILPLFNERNEVTGGLSIVHDTTSRKVAENKLIQREKLLKEAQEIAQLGSWEWIIRNNKFIWSDEVFKILGYEPQEKEMTLSLFLGHLYEEDENVIREIVEHSYKNLGSFSIDLKVKRRDGQIRYLLVRGKVMTYFNNVPYKMMGIAWDITDRKFFEEILYNKNQELYDKNEQLEKVQVELKRINNKLEQRVTERTKQITATVSELNQEIVERKKVEKALMHKNEELSKINENLDNFVYTVSHDLKSPISNIEGLLGALMHDIEEGGSETNDIINLMNQSILKFKGTIGDLVQLTQAQKSNTEDISLINVEELTEEIQISIKELINSSKATIKLEYLNPPPFKFSKPHLKSILYNLITNAIKYRHPSRNPEIIIKCESSGGYVLFSIKDNGLGIGKKQKDSVFTMFERVHTHVEGSGIGLYLVKRIVDNNGGKIELESEEGVGSEFKIYLKVN